MEALAQSAQLMRPGLPARLDYSLHTGIVHQNNFHNKINFCFEIIVQELKSRMQPIVDSLSPDATWFQKVNQSDQTSSDLLMKTTKSYHSQVEACDEAGLDLTARHA